MNEMVFEGIHPLFDFIKMKGGAVPNVHGTLGQFYAIMSVYTNPNACGCKKGKKTLDSLNSTYSNLHNTLTGQELSNAKSLFGDSVVVLKLDGAEVGRF